MRNKILLKIETHPNNIKFSTLIRMNPLLYNQLNMLKSEIRSFQLDITFNQSQL